MHYSFEGKPASTASLAFTPTMHLLLNYIRHT